MLILTINEVCLVFGGVDRGYTFTPSSGKYAQATVTCDPLPFGFFNGCKVMCNNVDSDGGSRLFEGKSGCAVDQAITCACSYNRTSTDNPKPGCFCTFEEF